jgi:hypothetical protein
MKKDTRKGRQQRPLMPKLTPANEVITTSIKQIHILRQITPQPSDQSHHLQQMKPLLDMNNHIDGFDKQWTTPLIMLSCHATNVDLVPAIRMIQD